MPRNVFKALWRSPRKRAHALHRGRVDLPFRLPAGTGVVVILVLPAHLHGPTRASVHGGRTCTAGRCVVRLKVNRRGVRAYAHKALRFVASFIAGTGPTEVSIAASYRLRMPLH